MPITYTIDKAHRLVHTRLVGTITEDEITAHHAALLADADFEKTFDDLADCSALSLRAEVSGSYVRNMALGLPYAASARHAIVVSDPTIFGLARMFQLSSKDDSKVSVFKSIEEGRAWLES